MDVALVVLDTLRKDAFDEYFEWLPGERLGDTDNDLRAAVDTHRDRIDLRDLGDDTDVSDAVRRQLEDLGYA